MNQSNRKSISGTTKLVILFLVLAALSYLSNLYFDFLWFKSVDYQQVFTTIFFNKIIIYALVFVIVFLLFFYNLQLARKHLSNVDDDPGYETDDSGDIIYLNVDKTPWKQFLNSPAVIWIFIGVSVMAALLISSMAADNWLVFQQYFNRVSMGTTDPIFNRDISFYFFDLSFYHLIYGILMSTLVLLTIAIAVVYLLNVNSAVLLGNWLEFSFAKGHLAVLIAAIFGLKAWGYRLNAFDILFSPTGIVFGATYSDIHARLLAFKVLLIVSLLIAAIILANIFVKRLNWILYGIGAWIAIAIILGGIYPTLVQKLVVQPNEFNKEKTNIENAIAYTRQAYSLDQATNKEFKIDYNLDIEAPEHQDTLNNVRLWDWQPLQTTYRNLQQLRPYYVFNDVDIDRYTIDGRYRQVMLSTREIDQEELPERAKTWINQKLMYTHGYGIVMSPVTEIAEEGFPQFFVQDIPPQFTTDLKVTRPEIYFGEKTDTYVIVNTKQQEFDYPLGDKNIYSTYKGKGGIPIDNYPRRILFSWVLRDYKMLLSSDVNNNSQILVNRNIEQRVQKIAPYLAFDHDPYMVVDSKGNLFWMLDAYTVSNKYPYSQPFDNYGNNYIRNSVKVTCNAYTGEMKFYVADDSDPIIKTYAKIFPGIYKPLSEMPEDLNAHVRYPEDIFSVQAEMYLTFHMTDPWVFYNKEDLWVIPNEIVDNKPQKVEPYYIVMRLPDENKAEYVLMMPFTPKSRPNMVAWMCMRMDNEQYGNMMVYDFPKQETIYGPEQIEARINQNTEIAQQITLWDQRGARIYRGNLLVIPMGNSILYVEPLYLQADNGKIPELKRVIAGFGNKIVMEPSLDQALIKLFGEGRPDAPEISDKPVTVEPDADVTLQELAKQARQYYDQAEQRIKDGDWAGYGESLEKLNDVLLKLEEGIVQE